MGTASSSYKTRAPASTPEGVGPFPYKLFYCFYHQLGVTSEQAMMILQQVCYWKSEARLPFPSNTTIAKRMGKSPRMLRRYRSELVKMGLLQLVPRYERGRQTSSELNYGPLVAALHRANGSDTHDLVPRSPMSGSGRTPASYLKRSSTSNEVEDLEKKGERIKTSLLPSAPQEPSEAGEGILQKRPQPSEKGDLGNPASSETLEETEMSLEDVQKVMELRKQKLKDNREEIQDQAILNRQRRLDQAEASLENDSKARRKFDAHNLKKIFVKEMGRFHPGKILTSFTKQEMLGFYRLLDAYDFIQAEKIIRFAVEHWDRCLKGWKKPPHPSIRYLSTKSVAERFIDSESIIRDFDAVEKAIADWRALSRKNKYKATPPELAEQWEALRVRMKDFGLQ